MKIQTVLRKWGNSMGVVIPKEAIKQEKFREGEKVVITIEAKKNLSDVFGSLNEWKIDSQKMKNEFRKQWK